jgi:hypothetical protein
LRDLGFTWVSSLYPRHPMTEANKEPTRAISCTVATVYIVIDSVGTP